MNLFMTSPRLIFTLSLPVIIFLATFASGAALVPPDEADALRQIGKTLGVPGWNFSGDPCNIGLWGKNPDNASENAVNCSTCFNINNTIVCHITNIILKKQNLPGTLPAELAKLPYLEVIDLALNYLSGTIPPEWGSMQHLWSISVTANRLTGSIPKELGSISTLSYLDVEFNHLSGAIPGELGNLPLQFLHLTSNNFSGELPGNLAKLTTLNSLRISDNSFTGRIPSFIESWINLDKLVIRASGLDGPIPPGIGLLKKLTDLRITDLNETQAPFPPLANLTELKYLILRSCNIIGTLPEYLGSMLNLVTLDLSFNKLTGGIPISYNQTRATFIYLTGNLLSGPVPSWIPTYRHNIDLSYNRFSLSKSSTCDGKVNLFGSSSEGSMSEIVSCLGNFQCPRNWSSFYINCGGNEAIIDGATYEDDTDLGGPSNFFYRGTTNWAFSSTGNFMDNSKAYSFTASLAPNTSRLSGKNSKLYMDARLSPLSLTYFGYCLQNGKYNVNLHFAEIMFTDDHTFSSLGRRLFDIYIQGKRELKDFNIEDAAGGAGKNIIIQFPAVIVSNSTLEIRLYWAGKGTTNIPNNGVYGPLISAIAADYQPPARRNSLPVGVVVGIVCAVVFGIILLIGILWWRGCLRRKDMMEQDMKGLDLQTGSFTLRQIKAATKNFDAANKVGQGGFGSVYKGLLSDGTVIAVKQLSSKSKQGNREFVNEIGMISALQHPHLVKLYGCCIEGNQLLLVYEYMENNSLARALFGPEECRLKLDWPTRYKICIGIARGLAYLHEESRLKIVHRDIKATNVLLDKNLNSKISDFGLAKLDEEDDTHISTRIAGTYGYMAPEYAMRGYLTDKADVYSFGIVALEIVSGRSNTYRRKDSLYLLDWAFFLKEKGNLMDVVDPRLGPDFIKEEVMVMINIALLCASISPAARPTMSSVVNMLEGRTVTMELVSDPSVLSNRLKLQEMMTELQHSYETNMDSSSIPSTSSETPLTASTSACDINPLSSDSDYRAKRASRKE